MLWIEYLFLKVCFVYIASII